VSLVQVSGAIDRILRVTRLNTVFATYDTIDEALAAAASF